MSIIGVISDTHGLLRPEAVEALQGSRLIVHAGDLGNGEIVSRLQQLAPVKAIRGNVDTQPWAGNYPTTLQFGCFGKSVYVLHDLNELDIDLETSDIDIIISGHSHKPKTEIINGRYFLNPGSAGPRRFKLPVTVARVEIVDGTVDIDIVPILVG